tara:strand:- start:1020 stop:1433 length:414 start_codon:yes stop_codon:yes gene_type:complete
MAKIDGLYVRVQTDSETSGTDAAIVGVVSSSLNITTNEIDTTSYEGGGDYTGIAGTRSADFSADFHMNDDGDNLDYFLTDQKAGTILSFVYGGVVTGDLQISGQCYITAINITASIDSAVNVSMSFRVTGSLLIGAA